MNTSNYVYNNTVEAIRRGHTVNFMSLRDKLVTLDTKKLNEEYQHITKNIKILQTELRELKKIGGNDEAIVSVESKIINQKLFLRTQAKGMKSTKNESLKDWECNTPKDIRAGAVDDVCKAHKTGFTNMKAGNIKHFRMGFRKKTNATQSILVPKNALKNNNGIIQFSPSFFKEHRNFKMGRKTIKKWRGLGITNDCRLLRQKGEYWLAIPIPTDCQEKKSIVNYCGVDPGVRTFMTTFGNNGCLEYGHRQDVLNKLNNKMDRLKELRRAKSRKRIRKQTLNKWENRKINLVNELHWKTVISLLKANDCIFYGDIKSHNIVKDGKNKTLNRNFNDLKFYTFKQRLITKANEKNIPMFFVNEAYTTQTCSFCGILNQPGCSKIYECKNARCNQKMGRDVNASKNILIKGIVLNQ